MVFYSFLALLQIHPSHADNKQNFLLVVNKHTVNVTGFSCCALAGLLIQLQPWLEEVVECKNKPKAEAENSSQQLLFVTVARTTLCMSFNVHR